MTEEIFNEPSIKKNLEEFVKEYYEKPKKSDERKKLTENIIVEKILKKTVQEDISSAINNSVLNIANNEEALLYIKIVKILSKSQKTEKKEEYKKIIKVLASAKGKHGNTLLHLAVISKNCDLAKLLLENGAKIDAENIYGYTPLHLAVISKNCDLAKLLLENGAKIDAKNTRGDTPLHLAVANGNPKSVEFLLENGAKIDAKNIHENTPLHYAAQNRQLEVLNTMLENGAKIDAKNTRGDTPLHTAILSKQVDVVEKLLEKSGIDVNIANKDGKTPLYYAKSSGNEQIRELLEKKIREDKAKTARDIATAFVAMSLITIAIAAIATKKIEVNALNITYAAGIIALSTLIASFTTYELVLKYPSIPSTKLESSQQSNSKNNNGSQQKLVKDL